MERPHFFHWIAKVLSQTLKMFSSWTTGPLYNIWNHNFSQMYSLIWTGFLGESCGPIVIACTSSYQLIGVILDLAVHLSIDLLMSVPSISQSVCLSICLSVCFSAELPSTLTVLWPYRVNCYQHICCIWHFVRSKVKARFMIV